MRISPLDVPLQPIAEGTLGHLFLRFDIKEKEKVREALHALPGVQSVSEHNPDVFRLITEPMPDDLVYHILMRLVGRLNDALGTQYRLGTIIPDAFTLYLTEEDLKDEKTTATGQHTLESLGLLSPTTPGLKTYALTADGGVSLVSN